MEEELNENIDSQLTDSLAIENNNYQFNNVVTNEYNSSEAPPENYTNISGNTEQTPFAIENLVTKLINFMMQINGVMFINIILVQIQLHFMIDM